MAEDEEQQIGVVWPDVADAPVHRVNQALSQLEPGGQDGPDGILLSLGYVAPPVVLGNQDEKEAMWRALGAVPVKCYGRFSMQPQRVRELINVLQTALRQYEEGKGEGG